MVKRREKYYQFSRLSEYSFKERLLIRLAGWLIYVLISAVGKTLRFEVEGSDYKNTRTIRRIKRMFRSYADGMIACSRVHIFFAIAGL